MSTNDNSFTIKETLLLSAAVGFFIIWVGEVFQGIPLKASYFWVMFSVGCLFAFQYTKNKRIREQEQQNSSNSTTTNVKKSKKVKK
ncbi:MAG: hypothetical protein U0Y10_21310 [Spirosomataceae bacterium]